MSENKNSNNNKSNINNNKNSQNAVKATTRTPLIQRKISEVLEIIDEVIPKLEKNSEERLKLLVASEKLTMLLEYLKYTWKLRKYSTSKSASRTRGWSRR